jgi:hypothetical protein
MSKVETDCPYCRKLNTVEKSSASVSTYGFRITCSHCSKSWDDSLGEDAGFFKSAPSGELAKLRENLAELGRVVDAFVARNAAPAKFQPQGEETAPTVLKFVAGVVVDPCAFPERLRKAGFEDVQVAVLKPYAFRFRARKATVTFPARDEVWACSRQLFPNPIPEE